MFRNLFLLIAIILLFWIIKGMIRRSRKPPPNSAQIKDMVQCEHCQSYLPKEDAVFEKDKVFCNRQHLQDWEAKL